MSCATAIGLVLTIWGFLSSPIRWLWRKTGLSRVAPIEKELQTRDRIMQSIETLKEMWSKETNSQTKLNLEKRLEDANMALIECDAEIMARTLKRAKFPSYDDLVISGRKRLAVNITIDNSNQ